MEFQDFYQHLIPLLTSSHSLKKAHSKLVSLKESFFRISEVSPDPSLSIQIKQHGIFSYILNHFIFLLGKVKIHGQVQEANKEFCKLTLTISDFLSIHQDKAATLLSTALQERARYGNMDLLEICTLLYHTERGYFYESILAMLTLFDSLEIPMESQRMVKEFIDEWISLHPTKKILETLESLKTRISKCDADQITLEITRETGLTSSIVLLHCEKLQESSNKLLHILLILCHFHYVNVSDGMQLLQLIKTCKMENRMESMLLISVLKLFQPLSVSISGNFFIFLHLKFTNERLINTLSTNLVRDWRDHSYTIYTWILFRSSQRNSLVAIFGIFRFFSIQK